MALQQEKPVFVLDTSFLISFSSLQYWAIISHRELKQLKPYIVIPPGVYREYGRLKCGGETSIDVLTDKVMELLGIREYASDEERIRLSALSHEEVQQTKYGLKTLSPEDKSVAQLAVEQAQKGKEVAVVSADRLLVRQVCTERDFLGLLNIRTLSPENIPVKHDGIEYLISNCVVQQVQDNFSSETGFPTYLAIASQQSIGGGVAYNILFGVYTNSTRALILPRLNGVTFIRVYPVNSSDGGKLQIKSIEDELNMSSSQMFATYKPEHPYIGLFKVENPIKLHERQRLIRAARNKSMTQRDRQLRNSVKYLSVKLAFIDDYDINRHDKVTVGRMQQMRQKIAIYG